MAHIQENQYQNQAPKISPQLSYSVFAEIVLPFLHPFLNDHDPRPTFILSNNTNNKEKRDVALSLLYANKAFHDLQTTCTFDIIHRCADLASPPARPNLIVNLRDDMLVHFHPIQTTFLTGWFCFAEKVPTKPGEGVESDTIEDDPGKELVYTSRDRVRLDWTRGWCPMAVREPEHYQLLRTCDW